MEAAVQSFTVLRMIGQSPFGEGKFAVVGEETDGAVTGFSLGFMGIVALVAIGSGSESVNLAELVTSVGSSVVNMAFGPDFCTCIICLLHFKVVSMVLTASHIVDAACISLFILTPIAVAQKVKLNKLGTLRSQHNELREQVNRISAQNERLKSNNVKLDRECTELEGVSKEYEKLVNERGSQVDRLVAIVKENGEIQAKVKKSLQTQVMQQAMETILKCDTDEDFAISQQEIPQLKLRLSSIPGVEFDEANFNAMFPDKKGELKLKDIMQLFRNLTDEIPENDNVFHLKPSTLAPQRQRSILGF